MLWPLLCIGVVVWCFWGVFPSFIDLAHFSFFTFCAILLFLLCVNIAVRLGSALARFAGTFLPAEKCILKESYLSPLPEVAESEVYLLKDNNLESVYYIYDVYDENNRPYKMYLDGYDERVHIRDITKGKPKVIEEGRVLTGWLWRLVAHQSTKPNKITFWLPQGAYKERP